MNKIKDLINNIELRLSDLFLFIGIVPFIVLLIYGQQFMIHTNPDDVSIKLWGIILLFAIIIGSWGTYLYLERDKQKNIYLLLLFTFLLLWGLASILIEPHNFSILMTKSAYNPGDKVLIGFDISSVHYLFFSFEIISIIIAVYIAFFVLPKRFKNLIYIKRICFTAFAFLFAVLIYSYITEWSNYGSFIKLVFDSEFNKQSIDEIYKFAATSFLGHHNAFGMAMLVGILFSIIIHSYEKKWYYYLFVGFFYLNVLFSASKTSIIISFVTILIYVLFRLIYTFRSNKKRSIIGFCFFGGLLLIGLILTIVSYSTNGECLNLIYQLIVSVEKFPSLGSRVFIWRNVIQLLNQSPLYYLFGRGFGLNNEMLYPMNIANHDASLPFITHNSYLALLAQGGIIFLGAFIALVVYSFYVLIKSFKKDVSLNLTILLGIVVFLLYSIIETNHYLGFLFMFIGITNYQINSKTKAE